MVLRSDSRDETFSENRKVGTFAFDGYPTYAEWISHFDMDSDLPDMAKLEPWHRSKLPVWMEGNAYLCGAEAAHQEKDGQFPEQKDLYVRLVEEQGALHLDTNLYDVLQPEHKVAHYINFGTGAYENGLHAAYAMTAMIAMTGNFGEPGRSVGGFDAMYGNFFGHALCAPSNGKAVKAVTWLAARFFL